MKIESSRQVLIQQTDERTFAFLELLTEPKREGASPCVRLAMTINKIAHSSSILMPIYPAEQAEPQSSLGGGGGSLWVRMGNFPIFLAAKGAAQGVLMCAQWQASAGRQMLFMELV